MSAFSKKLGLTAGTTLLALVVAEGLLSLLSQHSLRDLAFVAQVAGRPQRPAEPVPAPPSDAERKAGNPPQGTLYQVHEDPLVGYVMRSDAELRILDGIIHTDALGLRVRTAGPEPEGALRVVVLGDSVAFGYGVDDHETLAERLERVLADHTGRPVVCRTAATPSWNHRNALHFLIDHYDALRPDVVVYLPIPNDLSDGGAIYTTGDLRQTADPAAADPWLTVNSSQLQNVETQLVALIEARTGEPVSRRGDHLGPRVLEADLSPESRRRLDENADSIAALDRTVRQRGGHLLVAHQSIGPYTWHLTRRLQEREPPVETMVLHAQLLREFGLEDNNHPNARTLEAWGVWVAEALLERGWVERGPRPLPPVPEEYEQTRAPAYDAEHVQAMGARAREVAEGLLADELLLGSAKGIRQVYGGLNPDGSAKMHLRLLLRVHGSRLEVELAPLPGRPDLYPLAVAVDVDDQPVGVVQVQAEGSQRAAFALPAGVTLGAAIEVRLRPERWCVIQDRGRSEVASFRPLVVRCSDRPVRR